LAGRSGYAGSFATGALATVAATPCTAPFMGAAVGFAVTQPWPTALLVFEALGLGLALPYLLLTLVPAWSRFLPKPGRWMARLQRRAGPARRRRAFARARSRRNDRGRLGAVQRRAPGRPACVRQACLRELHRRMVRHLPGQRARRPALAGRRRGVREEGRRRA